MKNIQLPNLSSVSAEVVPAGSFTTPAQGLFAPSETIHGLPTFCRVYGVLKPTTDSNIRFEVWMPLSGWNGKFGQVGSGGFAGSIVYDFMAKQLLQGYATASTDNGHQASGIDASWALGHPEKVIDFGYRADHETNISAKALIQSFYGTGPAYSYFSGCSDGGREALMEAQRFPQDFNGILAGAPANYFTRLMSDFVWNTQALLSSPGSYIPPSKLHAIQAATLAACDAADGVKDGVLENPPSCHFNPDVLTCKGKDGPDCLTALQVEALKKIYSGLQDSKTGKQLFPGFEPGAELSWSPWVVSKVPGTSLQAIYGYEFFAYMVFEDPKWSFHSFDPVRDTKIADEKLGPIIDAINPDLQPFKARGGKLIQFHGWADPAIPPMNSVHYYESVVDKMGGAKNTDDFYRLFMAPGVAHCGDGPGPNSIPDAYNALVEWVEHGVAPSKIIAIRYKPYAGIVDRRPKSSIVETRPLCPYPQQAMYKGTGNTNDAANFVCKAVGSQRK